MWKLILDSSRNFTCLQFDHEHLKCFNFLSFQQIFALQSANQNLLHLVPIICLTVNVVKSYLTSLENLAFILVFFFLSEVGFLPWQVLSCQSGAKYLHHTQKILWSPLACDVMHFLLFYSLYFLSKQGQLNLGFIFSIHQLLFGEILPVLTFRNG